MRVGREGGRAPPSASIATATRCDCYRSTTATPLRLNLGELENLFFLRVFQLSASLQDSGGRLRKLLATADRQQCAPRWGWRCVRCWLRLQLPFLGALPSLPHSRRTRSRCVQSAVPTRACMRARGVHGGH